MFNLLRLILEDEILNIFTKFINDESGATAIEYGLLAALLGVSMITGAKVIGVEITGLFSGTDSELRKAFAD